MTSAFDRARVKAFALPKFRVARRRFIIALLIACSILIQVAHGLVVGPAFLETVPVDRLVRNIEAYLKDHPGDPRAYYSLGRVRHLSAIGRTSRLGIYPGNQSPASGLSPFDSHLISIPLGRAGIAAYSQSIPDDRIPRLERLTPYVPMAAEATSRTLAAWKLNDRREVPPADRDRFNDQVHRTLVELDEEYRRINSLDAMAAAGVADEAMKNFNQAIALDPSEGLYWLGRASLGRQWLDARNSPRSVRVSLDQFPELRSLDMDRVMEDYYQAFVHSYVAPAQLGHAPRVPEQDQLALESGEGFLTIEGQKPKPWYMSIFASERGGPVLKGIKTIRKIYGIDPSRRIMDPIIFCPTPGANSLDDLLAHEKSALFDAQGDGKLERWPWLKPTTAFLVWDPEGKGEIHSGRQLFGTATWWMMFDDGYCVMQSLDDNRDGALSGEELRGLAAWFDRNGNGASEPGEVVPLAELGIVQLSTRATGRDGASLVNPDGLKLRDGRTFPTYDWFTRPATAALR